MKTFRLFFSFVLFFSCLVFTHAQIHVDGDEDVGIGQSATDNSKVRVVNSSNANGFYLTVNHSSSGQVNGIFSDVQAIGLGTKVGVYSKVSQNASSTQNSIGFYNWIYPYGSGASYGISNWITNNGTGAKYGLAGFYYQSTASIKPLYGIWSRFRNYGEGTTYSHYQVIEGYGDGQKEGFYNVVNQAATATSAARGMYTSVKNTGMGPTTGLEIYVPVDGRSTKFGYTGRVYENSASTGSTYGIRSQVFASGSRPVYGFHNKVEESVGASGVKYGIYNYVEDASSGANKYGIYNYLEKTGTGTSYALYSEVGGQTDYAGYFAGNVVVTGTMIDGVSDGRLKEDTKDLVGALALVAQLQPKSYLFKNNTGIRLPRGRQYGLIAQELETVLPDLVTEFTTPGKPIYQKVKTVSDVLMLPADEGQGGGTTQALDANNPPQAAELIAQPLAIEDTDEIVGYEADQTFKAINYRALIPVLVAAIQEQQTEIEHLQKQQAEEETLRAELKVLRTVVLRLSKQD